MYKSNQSDQNIKDQSLSLNDINNHLQNFDYMKKFNEINDYFDEDEVLEDNQLIKSLEKNFQKVNDYRDEIEK